MLPLFYQCWVANSLLLKLLSHFYLIFRASDENKNGWGKTHSKRCASYQTHMATQCLASPQEVCSISDTQWLHNAWPPKRCALYQIHNAWPPKHTMLSDKPMCMPCSKNSGLLWPRFYSKTIYHYHENQSDPKHTIQKLNARAWWALLSMCLWMWKTSNQVFRGAVLGIRIKLMLSLQLGWPKNSHPSPGPSILNKQLMLTQNSINNSSGSACLPGWPTTKVIFQRQHQALWTGRR